MVLTECKKSNNFIKKVRGTGKYALFVLIHFCLEKMKNRNRDLVVIKTPNPTGKKRKYWGDYFLASDLADSIASSGNYWCVILPKDYWSSKVINGNAKRIIFLRGLFEDTVSKIEKDKTYMYLISHPDDVLNEELNKYRKIIVASKRYQVDLRKQQIDAVYLPQLTNTLRFKSEKSGKHSHNVLFVGNTRGVYRPSVRYCVENGIDIDVYGKGWDEFIPARYIKGDNIPNSELYLHYANSKIVLNDHWQDMKDRGIISNRIFDVTASRGFLISDHVDEIEKVFNGNVVTYANDKDLVRKIMYYLENEEERKLLSESAHEITKKHFSSSVIGKRFCKIISY